MPYTWNDNAIPEALEFCGNLADRIEEEFREQHNLGDEPFLTCEARQLRQIEDKMVDIIAMILFRKNGLPNIKRRAQPNVKAK